MALAPFLTAGVSGGGEAANALGSSTAESHALKAAMAAATNAGSVRITVQFVTGRSTGEVVQDSGRDSGLQTVAIGKERASVLLLGGVAYISGNRQAVVSYFGFPTSTGTLLAGRWISLEPSDSGYHALTGNLTLSGALVNVRPSGPLLAGKQLTVHGRLVRSISGVAPGGQGRMTLFVPVEGKPLPVEAVESSGSGKSAAGEIVKFSRWGEHVQVPKPSGAVSIDTLLPPISSST